MPNLFQRRIQKQAAKRRRDLVLGEGVHTIGELVDAVLSVSSPKDATEFYEGYLEYLQVLGKSRGRAEEIAKSNIGWCFGEGMAPDRVEMWVETCQAYHPIFGSTIPTAEEAYKTGTSCLRRVTDA